MDGLIGRTPPDPWGCDPSPGGEDRRIRRTTSSPPSQQGGASLGSHVCLSACVCVCVCACVHPGSRGGSKVNKVTVGSQVQLIIDLKHFG